MAPSAAVAQAVRAGLLTLALALVGCTPPASRAAAPDPVERGRYLVDVGGCHDCHTPKLLTPAGPMPDSTRLLSGHPAAEQLASVPAGLIGPQQWGTVANHSLTAWVGPWGTSFTANLTPDKTGLGGWTPEVFIETLRKGRHAGVGRELLPPMPWFNYAQMTDEDLRAVFAYLQSLPPVVNAVPAPLPPVAVAMP